MTLEDLKVNEISVIAVTRKKSISYILFNDEKLKVHTSTIEYFNIKSGDTLNAKTISKMKEMELKFKVEKYINGLIRKKPYTEYQIFKKCVEKFENYKVINSTIKELKDQNVIGDDHYLDDYLEYFDTHYYGKYYIMNFLQNAGISNEKIREIEFDSQRETEKAWTFFESIKNKFTSQNFAKQKKNIFNMMLKRGFGVKTIEDVLSKLEIDKESEEKKLRKDYKKVKDKFSDKFEGRLLRNKIITKLMTMGYKWDDIKDLIEEDDAYED